MRSGIIFLRGAFFNFELKKSLHQVTRKKNSVLVQISPTIQHSILYGGNFLNVTNFNRKTAKFFTIKL